MKLTKAISMAIVLLFIFSSVPAQSKLVVSVNDSSISLPPNYLRQVKSKVDKYHHRITGKTEKTLAKLAKWENKIHSLLQKANPQAAASLFDNQLTFAAVLEKYQHGQAIAAQYGRQYDAYRDKLKGTVKYLNQYNDSGSSKLTGLQTKLQRLDSVANNTEAIQQFIKERRQQLVQQAVQYIGKSKYLQKINKESWYYIETLRNYRELFTDEGKAEELAKKLLQKIPGFNEFLQKNSVLSGLFSVPGSGSATQSLAGLQTRASVQSIMQQQFGSSSGAMQELRNNVQNAQAQLAQLKDKIANAGGGSSSDALPDYAPKNTQNTKTFLQRIDLGSNLQHQRSSSFLPAASDIGLSVGYKLNDRSTAGIGISGRVGWGKNIQHIHMTAEGVGLRSFVEWKLKTKGSFWLSGGAELNYQSRFYSTAVFNNFSNWQRSALLGVQKKYRVGKKLKGSMSLLYDFLYNMQLPVRQPVVFRIGYSLK
jgi:hypothetical protein